MGRSLLPDAEKVALWGTEFEAGRTISSVPLAGLSHLAAPSHRVVVRHSDGA
jgi:hypothetical protein